MHFFVTTDTPVSCLFSFIIIIIYISLLFIKSVLESHHVIFLAQDECPVECKKTHKFCHITILKTFWMSTNACTVYPLYRLCCSHPPKIHPPMLCLASGRSQTSPTQLTFPFQIPRNKRGCPQTNSRPAVLQWTQGPWQKATHCKEGKEIDPPFLTKWREQGWVPPPL